MIPPARSALALILLLTALLANGCSRGTDDEFAKAPGSPKEAATQLESTFAQAPATVRQSATTASEAMRQGDFEKAVVALGTTRSAPALTVQQGLAVHHSMVALEQSLINAAANGDARAQRAYDLLKAMKRN